MEILKINVLQNQDGTTSCEDFEVLSQLPETDEMYKEEAIKEIQTFENISSEQSENINDYNLYKIITQTNFFYAAVKKLSPSEMRARCVDKPWNWIKKDPYLSHTLLEEAVVIDPQTGELPKESGDYTIDLTFGLCATGHYDIETKKITIADTTVVFDPWE